MIYVHVDIQEAAVLMRGLSKPVSHGASGVASGSEEESDQSEKSTSSSPNDVGGPSEDVTGSNSRVR